MQKSYIPVGRHAKNIRVSALVSGGDTRRARADLSEASSAPKPTHAVTPNRHGVEHLSSTPRSSLVPKPEQPSGGAQRTPSSTTATSQRGGGGGGSSSFVRGQLAGTTSRGGGIVQ